ncbi:MULTISPECIES: cellulose biosynthesis protein BcsG [unclassified Brenneria]|uniref:cellulose biosynthesis protein BcsG n=1 Tax=unclassified Brenneria TaxID=2634434 RepID=UPI0029C3FA30|nr:MULTISPECIES: cellulose biosynthesis protein BcsG [unclassified Brenneria]MDX5629975.1 cellulose biosynthesis protein BcsG [Brenneria sp. L3-3Z]MDX5697121.1 cellulose biosynthesis protein BcsG [Brenneria sp. L4-2C]MEE3664624.1 cellulose biosynthesis protein BcsG [Brenneria sp. g21c3]
MNEKKSTPQNQTLWRYWRGLGGWNLYFLLKFALLWFGYLNFHPLFNLIFLAFLLIPLPPLWLHRWRHIIAIPIGIGLFYHDTWLPGVNTIIHQGSNLMDFDALYLLELINRFINWQMLGAALVLVVAYLFLSQWIRITVFTVAILGWLNLVHLSGPMVSLVPDVAAGVSGGASGPANGASPLPPAANLPPTNDNLTAYLNQFYAREKERATTFPASLPADSQPFDLLIVNICSLSWSDMEASELMNHPLWSKFDILFSHFNSATAYSGPAAIRLLRASCGQASHHDLYQPANRQCYLFDNLANLGFEKQLMLDHSGVSDLSGNYLKGIHDEGNLQSPMMSQAGISYQLTSFEGDPIYNDLELLNRWLENRKTSGAGRSATFFNLISLHDGNRFVGTNKSADFKPRAKTLFDQLDSFFDALQKSGRKVMVVVVPEHGAALAGDKMQMSGLRDIPSPSITHIPVGVKLFGMQAPASGSPLTIESKSSYLAISALVSRMVDGKVFAAPTIDWQALVKDLPQSEAISENESAIVMPYQGKPYIRLNGGEWVPYPQ